MKGASSWIDFEENKNYESADLFFEFKAEDFNRIFSFLSKRYILNILDI